MKTIIRKNIRDGWEAITDIELGDTPDGLRLLRIHTSKRWDGALDTDATVYHCKDGGMVHAFGIASDTSDFRRTLERNKVRCTDKAVETQHDRHANEQSVAALVALVNEFYTTKEGATA